MYVKDQANSDQSGREYGVFKDLVFAVLKTRTTNVRVTLTLVRVFPGSEADLRKPLHKIMKSNV